MPELLQKWLRQGSRRVSQLGPVNSSVQMHLKVVLEVMLQEPELRQLERRQGLMLVSQNSPVKSGGHVHVDLQLGTSGLQIPLFLHVLAAQGSVVFWHWSPVMHSELHLQMN